MLRTKREIRRSETMGTALLKGLLWEAGITVAGAGLMAWLMLRQMLRDTVIGYCAMGILMVSSLLGALVSVRTMGRKIALTGLCSGGIYFCLLAALNALLYKGGYEGVGVTALLILGGAMTGVFLSLNMDGKKSRIRT